MTRRDSLSPLRIREGASEGARGVSGRAHPADLLSGAPLAPRPERLLGLKRAGGTRGGLGEPATRSELAGETSTEGGAGPGPRREEGRPQLHPAPLASFPALLRLLLLFLLYESGISQGFGAATRGPGARSCSSSRRRRHRVRSPRAGAAAAAGTRVPGAHGPWRGRPRAQTVAGAAIAAAAAAAAPPRRAPRPPAPWRAGASPAGPRQPGSAAGAAAAARARWPLARLGEAAAGGSRRSRACSANTPTSSRAGRTGKVPAARAAARPSLRAAQCVCDCVRARSYHRPAGRCHRRGARPAFPISSRWSARDGERHDPTPRLHRSGGEGGESPGFLRYWHLQGPEWQEERAGPGPCLPAVFRTPEEWLRKGSRQRGRALCLDEKALIHLVPSPQSST